MRTARHAPSASPSIEDEYANRSPSYGIAVGTYRDPALALTMIEDIHLAEGLSVLDLGAGQGDASWPLARSGADVVALDLSQDMLDVGARRGLLRVERSVKHDLRDGTLPFETRCMDIVLSRYVLHDLPELDDLFREVGRVLKPHGIFQMVDMSLPTRVGLSVYNGIHMRKAVTGRLPCWIREVGTYEAVLRESGFDPVRRSWYASVVSSKEWLVEGQVDEAGHKRLLDYVLSSLKAHPRACAPLGLSAYEAHFSARFPVLILTARKE